VTSSHQDPGLLTEGIARFVPPDVDAASLPRSFALVEPRAPCGPVPDSWRVAPSQAGSRVAVANAFVNRRSLVRL